MNWIHQAHDLVNMVMNLRLNSREIYRKTEELSASQKVLCFMELVSLFYVFCLYLHP
jgi:hypothetical protein